jgi:hypothetical protein
VADRGLLAEAFTLATMTAAKLGPSVAATLAVDRGDAGLFDESMKRFRHGVDIFEAEQRAMLPGALVYAALVNAGVLDEEAVNAAVEAEFKPQ